MVHAFKCETCQIRVYSATAKRRRDCPLCGEPMQGSPVDRPARGAPKPAPVPLPATPPAGIPRIG
jgi:hypothetical protein